MGRFAFYFFFLGSFLWTGDHARAGFEIWSVSARDKSDIEKFYVAYEEAGRYFVDLYVVPSAGAFQKRISQKIFSQKKHMLAHLKENAILMKSAENGFARKDLPISEMTGDVIWETRNSWSFEWERKYAEWIMSDVDERFLERFQIATDCADVAIAFRWIFARIHGLPMANTLAGTARLFTNESMRREWAGLPTSVNWHEDRRFRAALKYILDTTFTHSLSLDSYPVAINSEIFMPGVHHLNLHSRQTGHTMFVYEINRELGGVFLIYSSVPQMVRALWNDYFEQSKGYSSMSRGGFLKIRWAVKDNGMWSLMRGEQMPGYSLEQYDPRFIEGYDSFSDAVEGRLGALSTPVEKFNQGLRMLKDRLETRVKTVEDGFLFCSQNDCSPETLNYENWSTFSRDSRIAELTSYLSAKSSDGNAQRELWKNFKKTSLVIQNQSIKMVKIITVFQTNTYSSDPRHPIPQRWGL